GLQDIHEPVLWLLEGRYADGQHYTLKTLNDRLSPGRNQFTKPKLLASGVEVIWSLVGSNVTLSQLTRTAGHGLHFNPGRIINGEHLPDDSIFNSNVDKLKWIAAMSDLGNPPIRPDCIQGNINTCPLTAIFNLRGNGLARACHLLHDSDPNNSSIDYVRSFIFKNANQSLASRALSDATVVEFQVTDPSVTLEARDIKTPSSLRSVRVRPVAPGGRVTLLIANQPRQHQHDPKISAYTPHFFAYYKLTYPEPPYPYQPILDSNLKIKTSPGACELELALYEDATKRIRDQKIDDIGPLEVPHDKPACDSIRF